MKNRKVKNIRPGAARSPNPRLVDHVPLRAAPAVDWMKAPKILKHTNFTPVISPYRCCGYNDSPFARIHFYSAGKRNGLEEVHFWGRLGVHTESQRTSTNSKSRSLSFESNITKIRSALFRCPEERQLSTGGFL